MVKVKSLIVLLVLLTAALFVGCGNEQVMDNNVVDNQDINQPSNSDIIETPEEVVDEEFISADDEVEIGELI